MNQKGSRDLIIAIGRDLATGIGIGIIVAIIVDGSEMIFITLGAIGGVIGGRLIKKWWGAIVGGIAGNIALYLLVLVYLLLGGAQ